MSEKTLNSANAMDAECATKTLRDEFAMAAMQGFITRLGSINPRLDAEFAYKMADAMMDARNAKA